MRDLLIRFGLRFESDDDERLFGERYLLRTVRESQLFIVVSAVVFYIFYIWDRIIDPVGWETAQLIRGAIVSPLMILSAATLFSSIGKRHFEAIVISVMLLAELGITAVYTVLAHGFEYAEIGRAHV